MAAMSPSRSGPSMSRRSAASAHDRLWWNGIAACPRFRCSPPKRPRPMPFATSACWRTAMLKLRDLQCAIAQGVLGRAEPSILDAIFGDALDPAARLQIYRQHFQSSLTEALKAIYPVICRLVDDRFFAFV